MGAAAVDLAHLVHYTGGDESLNAEVLRLFDVQARELVKRLDGVLGRQDDREWAEIAHNLKGAAKGIGAFALANAAALAESVSPTDGDKARSVVLTLKGETKAVHDFIMRYLAP